MSKDDLMEFLVGSEGWGAGRCVHQDRKRSCAAVVDLIEEQMKDKFLEDLSQRIRDRSVQRGGEVLAQGAGAGIWRPPSPQHQSFAA